MGDAEDGVRESSKGLAGAALHAYLEGHLFSETERLLANNNQWSFHKHSTGPAGLNGRKAKCEQPHRDRG